MSYRDCPTELDRAREREADRLHAAANGKPKRRSPRKSYTGGPNLTDMGNAERLVARHGHDLRYCRPWGRWLAWDRRRWAVDDTGEVERRAKDTVRAMYAEAMAEPDPTRRQLLAQHAARSENAARVAAMVRMAQPEPGIPVRPGELDADPWALVCPNGTVDLRTALLRDHRREDLLTKLCPTPFDPAATCPQWDQFLATTFPAGDAEEEPGDVLMIRFVQRLLGYCLTGDVREQILGVFHGGGANGKTTLLNTVRFVMGSDYATTAPPELLMIRHGDQHPTEKAILFGMRVVMAMESQEGARLNESLVKALSGGDAITARRMREDFWTFPPTHKLILSTNHKPKVAGTDHAIWRRLRLVPFIVRFWDPATSAKAGEERPPALRADKALAGKLLAEAPGILAWMVRGCLDWQRDGLGEPPAVAEATEAYRESQDLMGTFLAERCTDMGSVRAGVLYEAFRKWSEAAGERYTPSQREFGSVMTERGYVRFTNNGTYYRGISLREDADLFGEDAAEAAEGNGT